MHVSIFYHLFYRWFVIGKQQIPGRINLILCNNDMLIFDNRVV